MSSETLVKRREPTPDLLDTADPDAGESVEIKEVVCEPPRASASASTTVKEVRAINAGGHLRAQPQKKQV